jgi:hypothetical protein
MAGSRTVGASVMAGSATTVVWGPQRRRDLVQWRCGASLAVGSKAVVVWGLRRQRDPEQRWHGGIWQWWDPEQRQCKGLWWRQDSEQRQCLRGVRRPPLSPNSFLSIAAAGPSDAQQHGVAQMARLGVALALSPLPPLSDDGGGTEARVRWPKQKIACIKVEYLQLSKIKSFQ